MYKIQQVLGSELQVGDTIKVWWSNDRQSVRNQETINKMVPYTGPLKYLFKNGAQLASFCVNRTGMTIDNSDYYERVLG